jgi:hypothetical protein
VNFTVSSVTGNFSCKIDVLRSGHIWTPFGRFGFGHRGHRIGAGRGNQRRHFRWESVKRACGLSRTVVRC